VAETTLAVAAFATIYLGLGLLAVSQRPHWKRVAQARGMVPPRSVAHLRGRVLGAVALAAGLTLALLSQGPSFGALLFALTTVAASVAVTFTLTWMPRWLWPLQSLLTTEDPDR
jgi:hypothetical protein